MFKDKFEKRILELENKIYELEIRNIFTVYHLREPNQKELDYWFNQISSNKISLVDFRNKFKNNPESLEFQKNFLTIYGVHYDNEFAYKELKNHRFYFPVSNQKLLKASLLPFEKSYENWKKIFSSIISPGMNVVNIGANVGIFTIMLSEFVGMNGTVYSVEPIPNQFECLKRNVDYNNCKNVNINQLAMSDHDGKIEMIVAGHGSYISPISVSGSKTCTVKTNTLDSFIQNDVTIDLIFMDAEGHEEKILNGAKKILSKNPNIKIITEFSPSNLQRSGTSPSSFLSLIDELGFKIMEIDEKTGKFEKSKDILNQFLPDKNKIKPGHTNLLLTK